MRETFSGKKSRAGISQKRVKGGQILNDFYRKRLSNHVEAIWDNLAVKWGRDVSYK